MNRPFLASAVTLACLYLSGCGGGSSDGNNNDDSSFIIDGQAASFAELQAEINEATLGDIITITKDLYTTEPVQIIVNESITITGNTPSYSSQSKRIISGNICFDIPDSADGHAGITVSNLHFEDIEMASRDDKQSCGSESASRSIINIGKVGANSSYVTLENLSFDGSNFDELTGNPTAWIYSRGLVKVINSAFSNKQPQDSANSIIYLNCGSTRASGSVFSDNAFTLSSPSSDVSGVSVGQFDGKACQATVTNNEFTHFQLNTTSSKGEFAAITDGSSDGATIRGNQFHESDIDPGEPEPDNKIAPFALDPFKNIIQESKLQRWDPSLAQGGKLDINSQTIADEQYYDDYFYAYEDSNQIVFKMSGHSNRSELRVNDNFDTSETGAVRTLKASFTPIGVEEAIANSTNGDEVTFMQVHNKGEDELGNGYIPHPLVRIVYEENRNGLTGHYWAVIKTNAVDCSSDSSSASSDACNNAYARFDLGKADFDQFTDTEITVAESNLVITVNNVEKVNIDISYWAHLLSYFKAGVYNQYESNQHPDDWPEVRFSTLEVTNSDSTPSIGWDIDKWKITIPASKDDWYGSGGSSAGELVPAFCNDSNKQVLSDTSDIKYTDYASGDISFFNVVDQRIHFRTDMGYGTSTSNSSYIRSELRELFNAQSLGTCSTSNQDKMTSWFIKDTQTDTNKHQLTSVLRIEDYPRISGQDPKVIVGQVHGWEISQALIKVLWEGENKPVRVIMNQDFFTNNEKCDSAAPVNNCDTWSFSIELGTYAANVDWQYEISVDEEGIYLATLDSLAGESSREDMTIQWGVPFNDKNGDSVTLTEKWKDEAYYFKAGIYPQFRPSASYIGERFDVSFSTINIEHQ